MTISTFRIRRRMAVPLALLDLSLALPAPAAARPLAEYDFAADDRTMKPKARTMVRMGEAISGEHLAMLQDRDARPVKVQCFTVHRLNLRLGG